jgi:hypothetical protein
MNRGDSLLKKEKFMAAINDFSTALLHCPDSASKARSSILAAFAQIDKLREKAEKNREIAVSALAQEEETSKKLLQEKKTSDTLRIKAVASEKIAIEAKNLSEAYKFIFFAQEVVNNDPSLALHLAKLSLALLDSVKSMSKNDSSIIDKAQRIYYENFFGNTVISSTTLPQVFGNNISAALSRDGKFLWTITDAAYALKWNLSGRLMDSIRLDPSLNQYSFKFSGNGMAFIHGFNTESSGKIWNVDQTKIPYTIPTKEYDIPYAKDDSVSFLPEVTNTQDWAKNLLITGYRVFSIDTNGNIKPVLKGISRNVRKISVSSNGYMIAVWNEKKKVSVFNLQNKGLFKISNTGNVIASVEFSPDNKKLIVKDFLSIMLYDLPTITSDSEIELRHVQDFSENSFSFQNSIFSKDGNMLLLSFSNKKNQMIHLYRRNQRSNFYEQISKFHAPGSLKTTAFFSTTGDSIYTSSDNVRFYKTPKDSTIALQLFTENEFISSVDFDNKTNLIYAYSISGNKKLTFNINGKPLTPKSADSTYSPESITEKLVAFLPNERVVIVNDNEKLNMYKEKEPLRAFLKTFKFEPFTEAQKRKYGIK